MGRVDHQRAQRKLETEKRMDMARNEDGTPFDNIPTYTWGSYVGGQLDGQEVIGRDLEKREVSHGAEEGLTYGRRKYTFGGIRVIAYVDVEMPKARFWPYELMRQIGATHHNLKKTDYGKARGLSSHGNQG